jgi:hypothetical protein
MHQLEFTHIYTYSSEDESVVAPVILQVGAQQVRLAASIDTGASFCVFGTEVADALGLTVDRGVRMRFRTANSVFEALGHEVEISVPGVVTNATGYFFADPAIDKNVLGRTGWQGLPGTIRPSLIQEGTGWLRRSCRVTPTDRGKTVTKLLVLRLLGFASSEKQIPKSIEKHWKG